MPAPHLATMQPLIAHLATGYAVFNIALGLALAFLPGSFGPAIASYLLNYRLWALLFIGSGIGLGYSLCHDQWAAIRGWLLLCLCFKFIWLLALLAMFVVHPRSPIVLILWAVITYLQAVLYVYFPAPSGGTGHE